MVNSVLDIVDFEMSLGGWTCGSGLGLQTWPTGFHFWWLKSWEWMSYQKEESGPIF